MFNKLLEQGASTGPNEKIIVEYLAGQDRRYDEGEMLASILVYQAKIVDRLDWIIDQIRLQPNVGG